MPVKCIAAIAVGFLTSALHAGTPDPAQILKKAQEAARHIQAVSYDVDLKTEGALAQSIRSQQGKVTMVRPTGSEFLKARVRDARETPGLELISDGSSICMIDHQTRQYVVSTGMRARRALGKQGTLLLREFVSDNAYADDIAAPKATYLGTDTVAGVECDVVSVVRSEGKMEVRWYLGKADALPRRVERTVFLSDEAGGGKLTMTLSNLVVDPPLSDDLFSTQPPPGYTRTTLPGAPRPVDPDELSMPRPLEEIPTGIYEPERPTTYLLEVGTQAPDWSLKTPDGTTVTLSGLRGRVVILVFWATWSRDCRAALPGAQKLAEHYRGKPVALYAINVLEPGDPVKFMQAAGYTLGLLLNGDDTAVAYGAHKLPVFYVISPEGKVLLAESGKDLPDKIKEVVDQALKDLDRK